MDEGQTEVFAVETTAEISMLRMAVASLMLEKLAAMTPGGREHWLSRFEEEFSDMPPADLPTPEATAFHEAVAAAMPNRVARFVSGLRAIAKDLP